MMGRHLTLFAGFFLILTALGCPREVPAPSPNKKTLVTLCQRDHVLMENVFPKR